MVIKFQTQKKKAIESDLEDLKKTKEQDDLSELKSKTDALMQSSLKLGEAIYKQNPKQGEAPPQPDPTGEEPSSDKKNNEEIVDADFEEVDENKK